MISNPTWPRSPADKQITVDAFDKRRIRPQEAEISGVIQMMAGSEVNYHKQPLASGSKRPSDIANLPRAFGHSADTRILGRLMA
jgi:hypothetical protein